MLDFLQDSGTMTALLLLAAGGWLAGSFLALLTGSLPATSRVTSHISATVASVAGFLFALGGLLGGGYTLHLPFLLPVVGFHLEVNQLGSFFAMLVTLAAIPISLYGLRYTRAYQGHISMGWLGFCYNLFLLSMFLVPLAGNVLTFLVLWELMSLSSYFLVITEHDEPETIRSGLIYAVMTHAGLVSILSGMLLLGHWAGSLEFAAWRDTISGLDPVARSTAFMLLALGFGSKAGLIPLHIWLPRAHPAAPSHVSALMSGVMVKLGIFGLLRFGYDLLGVGPDWWGILLLTIGAISSVLGILFALIERDLKRLLAFSTVENTGIITLALGASQMFRSSGYGEFATLALIAALYHTLNHTVFKSLLFLGAGSVNQATHTRNMDDMGGLIKRMPLTAIWFCVGAVAIAGLPPLNGFTSEWMVFQSLLVGFQIQSPAASFVFAVATAMLALTSGLAAVAFVKAFGITFLALPRSDNAERATESSGLMHSMLAVLALLCVALGVSPAIIVPQLNAIAEGTMRLPSINSVDAVTNSVYITAGSATFASVAPLWIALMIGIMLALILLLLRLVGANRQTRTGPTWSCGRTLVTGRMEYNATALSYPFKRLFAPLYRPVRLLHVDFHPASRLFVNTLRYSNEARSIIEETLYEPALRIGQRITARLQVLQSGSVHLYLGYILAALIVLLIITRQ